MAVSPFTAGIRCRCPNCGEGQVFSGFLRFKEQCEACGADLTIADAGDGPSFFVMFAALSRTSVKSTCHAWPATRSALRAPVRCE